MLQQMRYCFSVTVTILYAEQFPFTEIKNDHKKLCRLRIPEFSLLVRKSIVSVYIQVFSINSIDIQGEMPKSGPQLLQYDF